MHSVTLVISNQFFHNLLENYTLGANTKIEATAAAVAAAVAAAAAAVAVATVAAAAAPQPLQPQEIHIDVRKIGFTKNFIKTCNGHRVLCG